MFQIIRHAAIRLWELGYSGDNESNDVPADFWLVCHSKDFGTVKIVIESIHRYSLNSVRRIFLISNQVCRPVWLCKDCTYINENEIQGVYSVNKELRGLPYRGWVLQQVLKYSGASFSDRFVVVDCDTILIRPHLFFQGNKTILRLAYEYSPHYRHFERSLGINEKKYLSFICHMMPFRANILKELFFHIENTTGQPWQNYFASYAKIYGMSVSEYDLYARFLIQKKYPYCYNPWLNKSVNISDDIKLSDIVKEFANTKNSISAHKNTHEHIVIK